MQHFSLLNSKLPLQIGTLRTHLGGSAFIFWPTEAAEPTRHASGSIEGSIVDFMKQYLLVILSALGLIALLPQRAKADGYFGISVGPAYCDPYRVYYGGYYQHYYYPHYYRQYYYYDNPYRYGYWRHHRHWHHDDDDD